jgi:hypothetical protein
VELHHRLGHRPVRDPLPVGEAAAADETGSGSCDRLGDETRLSDPCLGDDREELASLLSLRAFPGRLDQRELAFAPYETRLVRALRRLGDVDEPRRRDAFGFALELERFDGLGVDGARA